MFGLNCGATNYYLDAKNQVQAEAASFQQVAQSLSASAQAQFDPTVAAAYTAQLQNYFSDLQRYQTKQNLTDLAAQEQYQAQLAAATNVEQRAQALAAYAGLYNAGSNSPAFPTDAGTSTNLPALPSGTPGRPNVTNVLSSQQFLPFQALLSGLANPPQLALSDRSAIITAAGDSATESMFRHFMGNTNSAKDSAEDNLFFGLTTVSVNPGWRTKKGWAAEVVMNAETYYTPARLVVVQKVFDRITNSILRARLYNNYGAVNLSLSGDEQNKLDQINVNQSSQPEYESLLETNNYSGLLNFVRTNQPNIIHSPFFNSKIKGMAADIQSSDWTKWSKDTRTAPAPVLVLASNIATYKPDYTAPPYWVITSTNSSITNTPTPVPVTIISPLIDAQTQDLSDSSRSQIEYALALSVALQGAGYGGAANAFEQYVKSKQFDVRTVSQSVTVNAISAADGEFGFQIAPRLQALGNPAKASGPGQILDRQSFPALLILALGASDLAPKLWQYAPDKLVVLEPQIRFTETRRWTPTRHFFYKDGAFFRFWKPSDFLNPPLDEKHRMEALWKLERARNEIPLIGLSPEVGNALLTRIQNMESQLAGGDGNAFFAAGDIGQDPPSTTNTPVQISITSAIPSQIAINTNQVPTPSQIVFLGTGLGAIDTNAPNTNVTILPSDTQFINTNTFKLERAGQVLELTFSFNTNNIASAIGKTLLFKLSTTNANFVVSPAITISGTQSISSTKGSATPSPQIVFSNTNGPGGFTYSIAFPTNVVLTNLSSEGVLGFTRDLIKSDLEKNKTDQSFSNSVLNVIVRPNAATTNGSVQIHL